MIDFGARDEGAHEEHEGGYKNGDCHVMALALGEAYGLPIGVILLRRPDEDDLGIVHFFGFADECHAVDVSGVQTLEALMSEWGVSHSDATIETWDERDVQHAAPTTDEDIRTAREAFAAVFPHAPAPAAAACPSP